MAHSTIWFGLTMFNITVPNPLPADNLHNDANIYIIQTFILLSPKLTWKSYVYNTGFCKSEWLSLTAFLKQQTVRFMLIL